MTLFIWNIFIIWHNVVYGFCMQHFSTLVQLMKIFSMDKVIDQSLFSFRIRTYIKESVTEAVVDQLHRGTISNSLSFILRYSSNGEDSEKRRI